METTNESMEFDVIIVGAGPSGLSTAIHLSQLAKSSNLNLNICVLEKGSEVGAHILSGAVFEPRALNELLPDWQTRNSPLETKATNDELLFLTASNSYKLPTPPQMQNDGNYIISLSSLCRWLATIAEELDVQIFPGFPANKLITDQQNKVIGVTTKEMGISKSGDKKDSYQPPMDLYAKYVVLAEGCRGSLTKQVVAKYSLNKHSDPQTYGLGIKELWEVPDPEHQLGKITHTIGWPLDNHTYGGSFIYHLKPNLISIGFVVGLDYANPSLDPFAELQRFKHHPAISKTLENGRRIAYGARTINEGGIQSIPSLAFPGGLLIGCSAGFLNVPKIKGNHTAMKSGMLAAESIVQALQNDNPPTILTDYETKIKNSWIWKELHLARNIRPAFKWGLWAGLLYSGIDTYLLRGKAPWTLHHHLDHKSLKPAKSSKPIAYPKPDNKLSFDKLSSVHLSNTFHEEDQPCHLKLTDPNIPIDTNLALYDAPETKYCPAGVYEIIKLDGKDPNLQINAQNCLHCKACDIKDPTQNITWNLPEGTGGPNYNNM